MWSHGCGWRGPCGSGVGPWTDCIGRGSPCWRPVPLPASPSGGRGEMVLKDAFPVEGEAWSFCLHQDMLVLARPQSRLSLDRKRSLCPFPVPRGWGPGQGPGPTLRDCPRGLPAEAQGGARQPGHTLCLQEALLLAQRGDSLVLQESRVAGAAPLRGGGVSSGGGLFAPQGETEAQDGARTCARPRSHLASPNSQARLCSQPRADAGPRARTHHEMSFTACAQSGLGSAPPRT